MMGGNFDAATFIQALSIWAIPVLFAITLHEATHGYVAYRRGDPTAWMLGRVTLNPVKHIDPFGTVLLPLMMFAFGGFIFGYAKPVPVNFMRLENIKWDTVRVAAAGPFMNLFLAMLSVGVLWGVVYLPPEFGTPLMKMAGASVVINLVLMFFNMFPILPLDGGRVLHALLPARFALPFAQTERYGIIVVLVLAFTGILGKVLLPLLEVTVGFLNHMSPVNLFYLINSL